MGEAGEDELFRLKDIVERHRGDVPLSLVFVSGVGERWIVRPDSSLAVAPSPQMLDELRALVGNDRIMVDCG